MPLPARNPPLFDQLPPSSMVPLPPSSTPPGWIVTFRAFSTWPLPSLQRAGNDQVGAAEVERAAIEADDRVGRNDEIGRREHGVQQQHDCRGAQPITGENPSELPRRLRFHPPHPLRGAPLSPGSEWTFAH